MESADYSKGLDDLIKQVRLYNTRIIKYEMPLLPRVLYQFTGYTELYTRSFSLISSAISLSYLLQPDCLLQFESQF